ncbi:Uncharacterised protein [Salmonella enterica]|nr:Uncharacterised protein [Salmonella enterica]
MYQPDTTAWSKAVCTATSYFFTCRTPCSCGWKTPCFSCNTDHLNIAFSNMFPDTGLAQGQTCQSGIWVKGNSSGIKAPPPQEIGCRMLGGSYAYARVDNEGQFWTRWNSTSWIKGSSEITSKRFIRVYAGGMSAGTPGGSTSASKEDYECTAAWSW